MIRQADPDRLNPGGDPEFMNSEPEFFRYLPEQVLYADYMAITGKTGSLGVVRLIAPRHWYQRPSTRLPDLHW